MDFQQFVGKDKLEVLVALKEDWKGEVREWAPNSVGTMDHRTDRANVKYDANGVVTRVWVG